MSTVFNFSAGPAMLPQEVLVKAQSELINWNGLGTSVMEVSHRGAPFIELANQAEATFRTLLNIPNNYRVLFMHGGGRAQFSAVPLNLTKSNQDYADFLLSGTWSKGAVEEAAKYVNPQIVAHTEEVNGVLTLSNQDTWQRNPDAKYFHYCSNETVDGFEINQVPQIEGTPIVVDMSSNILSKPIDVSQYGVIYAGAQKNMGPAGLTIVIVREDLIGDSRMETPSILNYEAAVKHDSMYNTPATFSWYLAGLVFEWVKEQGGVEAMAARNLEKSSMLYEAIDSHPFYLNRVDPRFRSRMNVPFQLIDPSLDTLFLEEAQAQGLQALKGHRIVGGMRASIYNAMPLAGVKALVEFMHDFVKRHG
jgi:phosphoserine aminotransferase